MFGKIGVCGWGEMMGDGSDDVGVVWREILGSWIIIECGVVGGMFGIFELVRVGVIFLVVGWGILGVRRLEKGLLIFGVI